MQVSSINNQTFGHSFRVSICTKDKDGIVKFVSPSKESKLYKSLNSKIVNYLNEDYYSNLRSIYGLQRKSAKTKTENSKCREMVEELRKIDKDYEKFNFVRSIYSKSHLGIIATGSDVSILENIKGIKAIGLAKSDSLWTNGDSHNQYVKDLSRAVKNNSLEYVQHDNVLLRSPRNKEITLKTIFKEGDTNKSGNINYELDDFEFHENYSTRTLAPVNPNFARFKQSEGILKEIKKTVEYHLHKMLNRRVHFNDIDQILYPKTEHNSVKTPIAKKSEKKQTFVRKEPKQLELDFKD